MDWKVAFPLHPEYRTLPMVWYIPPLSPIQNAAAQGKIPSDGLMPDINSLRIPVKYLANLLTAGKEEPVIEALERMIAMRVFMRARTVDGVNATEVLDRVGLDEQTLDDMYRIMALANFEDRYVIPSNHREYVGNTPFDNEIAFAYRSSCGFGLGNEWSDGAGKANLFGSPTHRNTLSGKPRSAKVKPNEDL
jgi:nitrate reductase beta subunit